MCLDASPVPGNHAAERIKAADTLLAGAAVAARGVLLLAPIALAAISGTGFAVLGRELAHMVPAEGGTRTAVDDAVQAVLPRGLADVVSARRARAAVLGAGIVIWKLLPVKQPDQVP